MKKISDANLGMHILEVEVTTRCNLNCKHCYNRSYKNIDLSIYKFKYLYNFANKYNIWTFIVSGGEAILSTQFDKIISYIKKTPHKFRLILQTNGLLIDDKTIEKIRVFDLIHISFDLSEDVRKGGNRNIELAKKLKEKGLNCYLFVTVHKKNRTLIDKMVVIANRNNIPIGFNICVPVNNNKLNSDLLMTKKEFFETERKLFHLFKKGKILRYSSPFVALFDKRKSGEWKGIKGGCTAGVGACVVGPTGELYPCPFFRKSAGNVFKVSLKELWIDSALFRKMRDRKAFKEPCGSCVFLSYCGGCRKRSFTDSGDIQGSDPMCYKRVIK